MKKKRNISLFYFISYAIGLGIFCGFFANGLFWYYQQTSPFNVSFNIILSGGAAGLLGSLITIITVILSKKLTHKTGDKDAK